MKTSVAFAERTRSLLLQISMSVTTLRMRVRGLVRSVLIPMDPMNVNANQVI